MENKYSKYINTEKLKNARPVTYYNIENGFVEPKISHINSISKILKMPNSNFFNFKGEKTMKESCLSKFIEEFEKLPLKEQLDLGNKIVDLINKSTNKLQNFDIEKINQSLSECFGTRE